MSLLQASILKTYKQDEALIAKRWAKFQEFLSKVEYIKTQKEEKYQDGFLRDIFEACLGYTLDITNPNDFNLEREKKNETDSKKADGVIYVNGDIVGVVELKDQKTKNLDTVESQAFNYHASHSNSKYIIISNFDELRFYIDKKTAYEKFSLFTLNYEEFKKLHLLLSYESIKSDIPLKLKEKSASFEQNISKELYKDFSLFRTHLFENIVKNNDLDKSLLLRLTQKLCDRIIFILFAEDRGLLTPNTIKEIRERHKNDGFGDRGMYDYYKLYFNAINTGNQKLNIPKYNGGLFAKDEMLDSLIIDDMYLDMEAQKLSDYDFESDIGVNILGHIFEQSLTDLEEINANIDNIEFDSKKSKRKKDGVFYTPEYITKYIVDNTLGKLCSDKRQELKLTDITPPKSPKKPTKQEQTQKENLEEYRNWLLNLKILDPACGSGAFLNQALDFLIKEHESLQKDLVVMGDITAYYEIEKSILEHNIYGVDINEDAVEIAKLSLWLRTASKGRELTSLAGKIKCGNSLIDDNTVAENAFVWEDEFPEVFAQGGFDVVIGNPPWGASLPINQIKHLQIKYPDVTSKSNDSYLFFTLLSLGILNKNGIFGFIIPNTWMLINTAKDIREKLLAYEILNIVDYGDGVFENVTAESSTIIIKNNIQNDSNVKVEKFKNNNQILENFINKKNWRADAYKRIILEKSNEIYNFIFKITDKTTVFSNLAEIIWGIKPYQVGHGTPIQTRDMLNDRIYHSDIKIDDTYKPLLIGSNINRYSLYFNDNLFIKYGNNLMYPSNEQKMISPKLLMRQTSDILRVVYDQNSFYCQNSIFIVTSDKINLKYLNTLLNSKLLNFLYSMENPQSGKTFAEIKPSVIKDLPIKEISDSQQKPFIQKADKMLSLNKELHETKQNFYDMLNQDKLTKKLQNFEELEFEEFVKEYAKAKKLKFADKLQERNFKQEWQSLFENDKALTCKLKEEISTTDKEIDKMVYELYELSDDEIKIVEGKANAM
ncbi:MAG: hypothetical protein A2513_00475 [Sulfurimonas sp. RIFOXYD12_FULL_33_39]|uniref:Eco57I restriction-modification methylase domain-containing protein n=1 Tax=unclassified Sulfurimonas TaxID=2623549 RepID=UPI0008C51D9C|nr:MULTISPECIES: N-6 DNA methylase [unclassified Sulfurimonas]OHE07479.1 MAG: hypothetical protein A3G74_00995 [Sulfurimonas sp. RIFCSPLOWO2_12_FULL_34_6]OHE10803.1 MAG: hypothetical protein A2513_00475 [Sulfurimonas sp. RIFOXYD12_FULL_33_39]OHE13427.1 MAG: hypothetical protein A2530_07705 [Sulfurimonas sp. RIFOXYD2_FULL_34_21]